MFNNFHITSTTRNGIHSCKGCTHCNTTTLPIGIGIGLGIVTTARHGLKRLLPFEGLATCAALTQRVY